MSCSSHLHHPQLYRLQDCALHHLYLATAALELEWVVQNILYKAMSDVGRKHRQADVLFATARWLLHRPCSPAHVPRRDMHVLT